VTKIFAKESVFGCFSISCVVACSSNLYFVTVYLCFVIAGRDFK